MKGSLCYLNRNYSAARQRFHERPKNHESVARAERLFDGALRMWHQAHHVALAVAHPRDVRERAVRIRSSLLTPVGCRITKNDLPVALELGERRLIAKIISIAVRDGHLQHLAARGERCERCF